MLPYQVYLFVGDTPPTDLKAKLIDITPATPDLVSLAGALSDAGIAGSDLRSRAVFVTDAFPSPESCAKALLAYSAIMGLARRRLDFAVGIDSAPVAAADIDAFARQMPAGEKPEPPILIAAVGKVPDSEVPDDCPRLDMSSRFGLSEVTVAKHARRLLLALPASAALALPQFVAVSSIRARGEAERLPFVYCDEFELDCEGARRLGEELRRTLRSDDRSALLPAGDPPAEYASLRLAAATPITEVLSALGARWKDSVDEVDEDGVPLRFWHCLKPENHTHGDATPSARVTIDSEGSYYRCLRCLPEKADALRLVMWAKGCTCDEAAGWISSTVTVGLPQ